MKLWRWDLLREVPYNLIDYTYFCYLFLWREEITLVAEDKGTRKSQGILENFVSLVQVQVYDFCIRTEREQPNTKLFGKI